MLTPTHLILSLAIAYFLKLPKIPTVLGGVLADLDVLLSGGFPLEHRGIVHTPFFLAVSVVLLYMVADKPIAFGFGAGFASHLMLDIITPTGIMLLYPLPVFFTLDLVVYNNIAANLGIILWSLLAIGIYQSGRFRDWARRVFGVNLGSSKDILNSSEMVSEDALNSSGRVSEDALNSSGASKQAGGAGNG